MKFSFITLFSSSKVTFREFIFDLETTRNPADPIVALHRELNFMKLSGFVRPGNSRKPWIFILLLETVSPGSGGAVVKDSTLATDSKLWRKSWFSPGALVFSQGKLIGWVRINIVRKVISQLL